LDAIGAVGIGEIGDIARIALKGELLIKSTSEAARVNRDVDLEQRGLKDLADLGSVGIIRGTSANEVDEELDEVETGGAGIGFIDDKGDDDDEPGADIEGRTCDFVLERSRLRHLGRSANSKRHIRADRGSGAGRGEPIVRCEAATSSVTIGGEAHTEALTVSG